MIWLVGNRGMLGSEVESILVEKGMSCIGTDREVDITRPDVISTFLSGQKLDRLDWILNCAAYTAVDKAESEREQAFALNAEGPLRLAEAAKKTGAALLHISTDYVFDGGKDGDYVEEDAPNPMNAYGESKLQGEIAVRGALERHIIVRTAWLYGRRGRNFVDSMLRLFRERSEVRVVADQWGNPTNSSDLAAAITAFIQRKTRNYGTFHFTNEGRTNWHQFACAIYSAALSARMAEPGVDIIPISTAEYPTAARRPKNSCLSKKKIEKELSIRPRLWSEAMNDYIREKAGLA
jgi:dTDP-4-dehydrorhamnose reductase